MPFPSSRAQSPQYIRSIVALSRSLCSIDSPVAASHSRQTLRTAPFRARKRAFFEGRLPPLTSVFLEVPPSPVSVESRILSVKKWSPHPFAVGRTSRPFLENHSETHP